MVNTDAIKYSVRGEWSSMGFDDATIKEAIRLACKGAGRTYGWVSIQFGKEPKWVARQLDRSPIEPSLVPRILDAIGVKLSDFWEYLEGGLGDVRIHLAGLSETAFGPRLRKPNRSISARVGREGYGIPIDKLESYLGKVTRKEFASYCYWFIANGSSGEKAEAWSVLGIQDRRHRNFRRSAYCHGQALSVAGAETIDKGKRFVRAAYLLQSCAKWGIAERLLERASEIFLRCGDEDWLGRVAIDLGNAMQFRGAYQDAIGVYQLGLSLTKDRKNQVAGCHAIGTASLMEGRVSLAWEMTELGLRLGQGGELFYIHQLRGRCYEAEGKLEECLEELDTAVAVTSDVSVFIGDRMQLSIEIVGITMRLGSWERNRAELSTFEYLGQFVAPGFATGYRMQLLEVVRRRELSALRAIGAEVAQDIAERRRQGQLAA